MMVMMTTMTMTMMMRRCMLNGVTHISVPMNTCPQHAHLNKQKPAHTHTQHRTPERPPTLVALGSNKGERGHDGRPGA